MLHDKPRLPLIRLLNDLADVYTALRLAGCPADQAERVTRAVAADRLTTARMSPPRTEPEADWIDGRWIRSSDLISED